MVVWLTWFDRANRCEVGMVWRKVFEPFSKVMQFWRDWTVVEIKWFSAVVRFEIVIQTLFEWFYKPFWDVCEIRMLLDQLFEWCSNGCEQLRPASGLWIVVVFKRILNGGIWMVLLMAFERLWAIFEWRLNGFQTMLTVRIVHGTVPKARTLSNPMIIVWVFTRLQRPRGEPSSSSPWRLWWWIWWPTLFLLENCRPSQAHGLV